MPKYKVIAGVCFSSKHNKIHESGTLHDEDSFTPEELERLIKTKFLAPVEEVEDEEPKTKTKK